MQRTVFLSVRNIVYIPCPRGTYPGPSHIVALWEGLSTTLNFTTDGFTKQVSSHRKTSLPSYTWRTACSCSGWSTIPAFPTFCRAYKQLWQTANHSKKMSSWTINFVTQMYIVSILTLVYVVSIRNLIQHPCRVLYISSVEATRIILIYYRK